MLRKTVNVPYPTRGLVDSCDALRTQGGSHPTTIHPNPTMRAKQHDGFQILNIHTKVLYLKLYR